MFYGAFVGISCPSDCQQLPSKNYWSDFHENFTKEYHYILEPTHIRIMKIRKMQKKLQVRRSAYCLLLQTVISLLPPWPAVLWSYL